MFVVVVFVVVVFIVVVFGVVVFVVVVFAVVGLKVLYKVHADLKSLLPYSALPVHPSRLIQKGYQVSRASSAKILSHSEDKKSCSLIFVDIVQFV